MLASTQEAVPPRVHMAALGHLSAAQYCSLLQALLRRLSLSRCWLLQSRLRLLPYTVFARRFVLR